MHFSSPSPLCYLGKHSLFMYLSEVPPPHPSCPHLLPLCCPLESGRAASDEKSSLHAASHLQQPISLHSQVAANVTRLQWTTWELNSNHRGTSCSVVPRPITLRFWPLFCRLLTYTTINNLHYIYFITYSTHSGVLQYTILYFFLV